MSGAMQRVIDADAPVARPQSTATARIDMGYAWWALVAILLSVPLLTTKSDPDIWGNTRLGLDILRTHTLPLTDAYSFTQDRPWVNHEWLSQLLFGAAYRFGGTAGLILLKTTIVSAGFLLIAFALRRVNPLVSTALLALAMAASSSIIGTVRPQIWTFLALVILVHLLDRGRYWWCPPLFAAWVNLHGGWVVGAGLLGVWCAVTGFQYWRATRRAPWTMIALPLVAGLATILNPYGWRMWYFLATTLEPNRDISEWRPLYAFAGAPWVAIALVTIVTVLIVSRANTRPTVPWLAVLLVLALGAISVARVAFLAMPLAILIAGPQLASAWPRAGFPWIAPSPTAASFAVVPVVAVLYAVLTVAPPSLRCIPLEGAWIPDTQAGPAIEAQAVAGRIVTQFEWGHYAIWHFAPRLRVSWDGRRETLYSGAVTRIHDAIYDGEPEGDAWLTRMRPEYVWLRQEHLARRAWLERNGYRIDLDTPLSYVAVRRDLPVLTMTAAPAAPCAP